MILRGNRGGMRGVYSGMFEQSILVRQQTTKPWTVAATLATELAGIGLLILIPLVWTQNMPGVLTKVGVWLPPSRPPEIKPQPVQTGPRPPTKPSPWQEYYVPHVLPPRPVMFDDGPPDVASSVGTTSVVVPGMLLSQFSASGDKPPEPPQVRRPVQASTTPAVIRVSHIDPAKLLYKVVPEYPRAARIARIQGVVRLAGVIATDGSIRSLQVISGPALLVNAAVKAVQQWRFQPTVLNGQPVEVIAPIDVTFTLQ